MPAFMIRDWRLARTFDRDVWRMLGVFALSGFAFFGVQAVLLNLYLLRLGYGADFIGPFLGLGQAIWAISALPAGVLGRRLGPRPTLIAWQALMGAGLAMILLVEALPGPARVGWLLLSWAVYWVGHALGAVNANPYIMQVTTPENRNTVFSAQVAVFATLGLAGSALAGVLPTLMLNLAGGSLDDPAPYRLGLWLAPLVHAIGAVAMTGIRGGTLAARPGVAADGPRPIGLLFFFGLVIFLQTASEGATRAFFNVYLDTTLRMPAAEIGAVFALGQFVAVIGALLAPGFLRRSGTALVIAVMSAGNSGALALLGAFPNVPAAVIGYAAVIMFNAFLTAARMLYGQQIVAPGWRTLAASAQTIGLGLGWGFSAVVGGAIVTGFGFGAYFALSAAIAALGSLLMFARGRRLGTRD